MGVQTYINYFNKKRMRNKTSTIDIDFDIGFEF